MIEHPQGSEGWKLQRLGKVTASRVADVVARTKTGPSASRQNYMSELLIERLTGVPAESYQSAAMLRGTETEAAARAAYAFMTDSNVEPAGFVDHPTIAMCGASPDGYVGSEGLVEFKCPLTATHVATLRGGSIPGAYITQVQWQLACCVGRKWTDYVSFDDRLPPSMQLHITRVYSDGNKIMELETEVARFLIELDKTVAELRSRYETRAAA